MDDSYGGSDGSFRVSIRDSIMMWILHSAMNRAHEKVQSKEGVIERLCETSKFYELAIMQIEGCLKFVQHDYDSCTIESSHEKMLLDLSEVRDRLVWRLRESQIAIFEKDRELNEMIENEMRFRQVVELKERELVSLRSNLEIERTKSDMLSGDEGRDGEICELKNSVDQQYWNIKQKLEDERMNQGSSWMNLANDREFVDVKSKHIGGNEANVSLDHKNGVVRRENISVMPEMNIELDIDSLKGTLDIAFGIMQTAISSFEEGPWEKQWRWTIEQHVVAILIKGFMRDMEVTVGLELTKRAKKAPVGLISEQWSEFMNEIEDLHRELKPLCYQPELSLMNNKGIPLPTSNSSHMDVQFENSLKAKGRSLSEGHDSIVDAMPKFGVDCKEEMPEGEGGHNGGHYVAKMIKNHESIIRRKREELNRLRRESMQERGNSAFDRDKDRDSMKRMIHTITSKLENIIKKNAEISDVFDDYKFVQEEKNSQQFDSADEQNGLSANKDVHHASFSNEELQRELRKLKQEVDDIKFQLMTMDDTYAALLNGLMEEFLLELYDYEAKCLIRENIFEVFFMEKVHEWNKTVHSINIETQIRQEICFDVFSEVVKDFGCTCFESANKYLEESLSSDKMVSECEGAIREDVCRIFLRETIMEWNQVVNSHFKKVTCSKSSKSMAAFSDLHFEGLLKEDVCKVLFKEMVKAWRMEIDAYELESLMRDELYQFVIVEATKDAYVNLCESNSEDKSPQDVLSSNKFYKPYDANEIESIIQKLNSLIEYLEVEEELMTSAIGELKEHNVHLNLDSLEPEERTVQGFIGTLVAKDERNLSSVSKKLEKALKQLVMTKSLLQELGSGLSIKEHGLEKADQQMTPTEPIVEEKEQPSSLSKDNDQTPLNSLSHEVAPILEFQEELLNFELKVLKQLGINISRLEGVKYQYNQLADLFTSVKKEKLLYKSAFMNRCQNLQKAEIEVDMLGDQVEGLLDLLEKIYMIMDQHSPVLQQFFEVSNILKLIKKEIIGVATHTPDCNS